MTASEEPGEALDRRIGFMLLDAVDGGWLRIDFRCKVVSDAHDLALTVLLADGSSPAVPLPEAILEPVLQLREEMYREGRGTWFSARWTLEPPGRMNLTYNLDWDPLWEPDVPASSWRADLEAFPRDGDHMPEWLRMRLAEADEGDGTR
ncbi:hypothetical protein [Saccharomonospora cyanea]|uniref:Uncharacterized protein n=1 Tax=Saccharomonospora cyanea NA-134 TaxID=882082 RepID=H5XLV7_9PSEU|nr:hypothetical protein [Saccharomonospora cyanea]EHR61999.1 hypothetical protein SaccyDRAFT_3163 [Saccharomonospora cyanea NA-134]